jgi:hypothetical protein
MLTRTCLKDKTLQKELRGYSEYAKQTRFCLFPQILQLEVVRNGFCHGQIGLKQYRGHCGHGCVVAHVVKSKVKSMPMRSCSSVTPLIMPGSLAPFSSWIMPTA